ncbi:adenylate kinase-domain-containing protein [Gaertneriomyces semiglobifer]|nr:adenylate kinase-domain-containing protein [Gaertneriomyces semiglobifer]
MNELLARDRTESLAEYADRHELFDLFEGIVLRMVIERPDDVFQFMIDQLQKPKAHGVVIIGPPALGHAQIAEKVAQQLGVIYISTGKLLQTAIERQTSLGTQARTYLERRQYVPDNVMLGLVSARLQDPEIASKGFILEGFPRTREQAKGLLSRGYIPDRVVVLEAPDEAIVQQVINMRVDPTTNRVYHLVSDPPPNNPALLNRLIQRSTDTETAIRARLAQYWRHLPGVMASFSSESLRLLVYPEGAIKDEEQAVSEVIREIEKGKLSRAPRMMKLVLSGPPGAGKTEVARMLEQRCRAVAVSPRTAILEQISLRSVVGRQLAPYANNPDGAPEDQIIRLIANRLQNEDCRNQGWVLDGFPRTRQQLEKLREAGVWPNSHLEYCSLLQHRRHA